MKKNLIELLIGFKMAPAPFLSLKMMFLVFIFSMLTVKADPLLPLNEDKLVSSITLSHGNTLLQQKRRVQGIITDEMNQPMPGVTIREKGTSNGVATDMNGKYVIDVTNEKSVLIFSFIGYEPAEQVVGTGNTLNMQLMPKVSAIEDVVVIGYGTAKAKDITGAVTRVSSVEMEKAPMGASVQSLLQGRAAGVNVQFQSASPTSPISVIIRGASSLTGDNQPLWVIDGVPEYSAGTSGNVANTLYNLNLNDVESIDILKDASATAIYGSRAASGVVIVTTKRGKEGSKPTIEFATRVGYQKMDFNGYHYFEAPEYIAFAEAAAREEAFGRGALDYFTRRYLDEQAFMNLNDSEFDRSDFVVIPGAFYEGNTNWQDEMTQNPWVNQEDLSLRGGTDNIAYFVSINHNFVDGIVKTGYSRLYGGRLNLEAKISKPLKFGINLSGSSRETDDKDYMLTVLKKVRPDLPAFNEDGTIFTRDAYTENPYTTLLNTLGGYGKTFSGTGFLELTPIEGLILKTSFTTNFVNSESLTYKRRGSTFNYTGTRDWSTADMTTNVWENTATYALNSGKHDLLALAGFSMEDYKSLTYGMSATNFPDDDILNDFSSAATIGSLTESYTANSLISEFLRATYKFNNRYILSGTLRADGSSRFGPDRRWGLFPSGAVAWLITEENFMKGSGIKKYVSYLKLRASRGLAGSQNLGNYAWRTGIGSARYNENPAIVPSTMGNSELQWEETTMTDIGLDYGLWHERIRGSFGVYEKLTDQLIYSRPLPPSSAFTSISSNVASMRNRGIEFDVKVDVVQTSDLTLTIDFNAARNRTEVLKINGVAKEINFSYMLLKEGGLTSEWYGFETANRLFVTQEEIIALQTRTATGAKTIYRNSRESVGDLYFIDQNNDGIITNDDKVNIGSAEPKLFGGFGATMLYKGLMVNTTFSYAYGHKRLWDMPRADVGYVGNYNHSNLIAGNSATLLSPYEATIPRMTQYGDGGNSTFSDFWLYNASYMRLTALNISYRLPAKWFGNALIQGIDLTFQGTNLFTLTKYPGFDPQGNWTSTRVGTGMGIDYSSYPAAKNFNFGIKFTLK